MTAGHANSMPRASMGAALRASYLRCRTINAAHGKTFYLATLLLPPAKRPYVHALYGFARHVDDYRRRPGTHAARPSSARRGCRNGAPTSSPTWTGARRAIR